MRTARSTSRCAPVRANISRYASRQEGCRRRCARRRSSSISAACVLMTHRAPRVARAIRPVRLARPDSKVSSTDPDPGLDDAHDVSSSRAVSKRLKLDLQRPHKYDTLRSIARSAPPVRSPVRTSALALGTSNRPGAGSPRRFKIRRPRWHHAVHGSPTVGESTIHACFYSEFDSRSFGVRSRN